MKENLNKLLPKRKRNDDLINKLYIYTVQI